MIPRSVNEVMQTMRRGLQSLSSPLANFSPFSNIYALLRSSAIIAAEQDLLLSNIENSFYLDTAKAEELDRKASDVGLARQLGLPASGFVLASASQIEIPSGTVLTNAQQTLQFTTTADVFIYTENPIPITSVDNTSDANLDAGIRLFSARYPQVTFVVGKYRDPTTKEPQVSLVGGKSSESDRQLRSRISSYITSLARGTREAIYTAILSYVPGRIYIKEHTPATGFITVYIDSQDARVQASVRALIDQNKASGVSYIVKPLQVYRTSVSLLLNTDRPDIYQATLSEVKARITSYGESIPLGGTMSLSSIAAIALAVPGITNCQVITPTEDISVEAESAIGIDSLVIDLRIV
jgi:uncharacterized phage protein gp47/JayE